MIQQDIVRAANIVFYEYTKHIDCDIVRENLKNDFIHLLLISTRKQLADVYTQNLRSSVFQKYLFQIGSHQYLLPNLRGVEDMDTRLLEEN